LLTRQIYQCGVKESLATIPSFTYEPDNSPAIYACESLCASDSTIFTEEIQHHLLPFGI